MSSLPGFFLRRSLLCSKLFPVRRRQVFRCNSRPSTVTAVMRVCWKQILLIVMIVAVSSIAVPNDQQQTCADQLQECAGQSDKLEQEIRRNLDAVYMQCTDATANKACRSDWFKYQHCMSQITQLPLINKGQQTSANTATPSSPYLGTNFLEAMRVYKAEINRCIQPATDEPFSGAAQIHRSATVSHARALEAAVFDWTFGDDFWGFRIPSASFECGFTFGKISLFGNGPITTRVESTFKSNCTLSEREFRCILDRVQSDFRVTEIAERLAAVRSGCIQSVMLQTRCQPILSASTLSTCLCDARDRFEKHLEKSLLDCMSLDPGIAPYLLMGTDADATNLQGPRPVGSTMFRPVENQQFSGSAIPLCCPCQNHLTGQNSMTLPTFSQFWGQKSAVHGAPGYLPMANNGGRWNSEQHLTAWLNSVDEARRKALLWEAYYYNRNVLNAGNVRKKARKAATAARMKPESKSTRK